MLKVSMEEKPREEIFHHRDDDGTFRHFNCGLMNRFCDEWAGKCEEIICARLPIERRAADHIRYNMGVEQQRLDRMIEPYLSAPIIAIFWEDNKSITVVDGNHRYLKRQELCLQTVDAFIFKYDFWSQFLVPLPDGPARLTGDSGVIEAERSRMISGERPDVVIPTCHAVGCSIPIKPDLFMCKPHWQKVPQKLRKEIMGLYRPGQCDDRRPSKEYLAAAKIARELVYRQDHRSIEPVIEVARRDWEVKRMPEIDHILSKMKA